ncbi:trypsin-like serine peptidase [Streptomyces sp. NPDC048172]|uniref:trypsin-like serine peptidase n=1 Tax=Streptomyces sp. NPDC048172 TaxID=3365505 RepID=UPI00371907E7
MSLIRRPGNRRRALAAFAAVAALAVTATACDSGGGDDTKSDGAKAGASADAADKAKEAKDRLGLPKDLPDDLPTSLEDLDKWRGGAWKNWDKDQWLREAGDFLNPYIKGHWKPERMKKAEDNEKHVAADVQSASGSPATEAEPRPVGAKGVPTPYTRNAAPAGKVFMDTPSGPMVCSGTVVKDPRNPGKSNLVATAGHCVHSGKSGGWLRNISFIPAYNDKGLSPSAVENASPQEVAPYGQFWAKWAQTSNYWIKKGAKSGGGGSQQDFAVLRVEPVNKGGKSLEESVGAAVKVNFKAPTASRIAGVSSYGYPAAAPFNGAKMYRCTDKPGKLTLDPQQPPLYRIGCTMTGGSSGGGWLIKGAGGKPELISVNSIGPVPAKWLAGPRLGSTAKGVFDAISKKYAGAN